MKLFDTIFEPPPAWLNHTFGVDESNDHDHDHQVKVQNDVPRTSIDMFLSSILQHTLFDKVSHFF